MGFFDKVKTVGKSLLGGIFGGGAGTITGGLVGAGVGFCDGEMDIPSVLL